MRSLEIVLMLGNKWQKLSLVCLLVVVCGCTPEGEGWRGERFIAPDGKNFAIKEHHSYHRNTRVSIGKSEEVVFETRADPCFVSVSWISPNTLKIISPPRGVDFSSLRNKYRSTKILYEEGDPTVVQSLDVEIGYFILKGKTCFSKQKWHLYTAGKNETHGTPEQKEILIAEIIAPTSILDFHSVSMKLGESGKLVVSGEVPFRTTVDLKSWRGRVEFDLQEKTSKIEVSD